MIVDKFPCVIVNFIFNFSGSQHPDMGSNIILDMPERVF